MSVAMVVFLVVLEVRAAHASIQGVEEWMAFRSKQGLKEVSRQFSRQKHCTNEGTGEADASCSSSFGNAFIACVHHTQRKDPVAILHQFVL